MKTVFVDKKVVQENKFKIDLIVWKLDTLKTHYTKLKKFKIDLIVWKLGFVITN